jgi:hypothetical protein
VVEDISMNELRKINELTEEFIKNKDVEWGIYALLSPDLECLYIGKSEQLKRRIFESYKSQCLKKKIYYASYAETDTLSDMIVYEKLYINDLKPVLNRQEKYTDDLTIDFPPLEFSRPFYIGDDLFSPQAFVEYVKETDQWNPHPTPSEIYGRDYYYKKRLEELKQRLWETEKKLRQSRDVICSYKKNDSNEDTCLFDRRMELNL